MSYVTLELAKQHLAMMHDDDDVLIQQCIDAAESQCASIMNRDEIADMQPSEIPWETPSGDVPPSVVQAVLLYMAEFYEQRTVGVVGTIYTEIKTANALLHFHRVFLGI